ILKSRLPVRIDRITGFIEATQPRKNLLARPHRVLNRIVEIDKAYPLVHKFLNGLHVAILNDWMPSAAIHEKDHGPRVFEGSWIARPAIASHHRIDTWGLLQEFHQDRAAGEKLMFAGAVAGTAGHEDDLGEARVRWLNFDGHGRLIG